MYVKNSLFILFFVMLAFNARSQAPVIHGDSLITGKGKTFIIGQYLKIGQGSRNNGNFEYIHVAGVDWNHALPINKNASDELDTRLLANNKAKILSFRKSKNSSGYIIKIEFAFTKYWCDIEHALKEGEVIAP